MKALKWIILSVLMLGFCSSQLYAQCFPGIGIQIIGEFQGTEDVATTGHTGDTIDYDVIVTLPVGLCPITDATVEVTLPDLSVVVLDAGLSLNPGEVSTYTAVAPYMIDAGDKGQFDNGLPGLGPDDVRAEARVVGTAHRDDGGTQNAAAQADFDTLVTTPCVEITKEVDCSVSKEGDEVEYTITITNCGDVNLVAESITDDVLGTLTEAACDVLDVGESCVIVVPYTIQPGDPDPLVNTVTAVYEDTVGAPDTHEELTVQASATVDLVHPCLTLEKSCLEEPVAPGGVASFRITVTNCGDVALLVDVDDLDDPTCNIIDLPLEPGASGTCDVFIDVPVDTMASEVINRVTATWTILDGGDCLPNTDTVNDETTCSIEEEGGATRTPGFWKTHTMFTEHVLTVHIPECLDSNCIDLGWIQVCSIEEVCAVFWANPANNSDGSKRDKLCQARMHASFHALAAILNNCVPSGATIPVSPAEIAEILGGEDIGAIKELAGILAEYNESGDDVALIDPDAEIGSATPQECRGYDQSFADCINGGGMTSQGKGKNK